MTDKKKVDDLIENGKHFCMIPWIHFHATALGNMSPCMSLVEGYEAKGYGNLNENSFSELWQGEKIRKLRLRMLEDKPSFNCTKCYEREEVGYWSQRQDANKKYAQYKDWVSNTDKEGYAADAKPVYWDIRFSNLCNLKCRMCGYGASSSWYEDAIKLGEIEPSANEKIVRGVQDSTALLQDLDQYVPHLEKVHFAGGEPLILKENYYILERLIDYKKFDTEIKYNTNLTTLTYKNKDVMELWKHFNNIKLHVSMDGVGEKCEYIRKNLRWNVFVKNIERIKANTNINVIVNITVSIFNILDLVKIHKYMMENGYIDIDHICLNLLHTPDQYNVKILPFEVKKAVTAEINDHINWMKNDKVFLNNEGEYYKEKIEQWESIVSFMNSEDWTNLIPKFIEKTEQLDEIRDEKLLDVFPELEVLYKHKNYEMSGHHVR